MVFSTDHQFKFSHFALFCTRADVDIRIPQTTGFAYQPQGLNSASKTMKYLKSQPLRNSGSFDRIFSRFFSEADAENIHQGLMQSFAICSTYSLGLDTITCSSELQKVLEDFKPYKNAFMATQFNAIPFLKKFLANPIHDKVMRNLAELMVKRIQEARSGSITSRRDLFSDLYQGYFDETQNSAQAEDLTWEALIVYASRGPNFETLVVDPTYLPPLLAATIFFTGATELDIYYRHQFNEMYSFPKEVHSTCDTGKSYHFWMPAAISRIVFERTKKSAVARAVAHIVSVGYQMRANVKDRNSYRAFTVKSDETGNQKIRMDLAYGAVGSMFGSKFTGKAGLDIDQSLKNILEQSQPMKPVTEEKAKKLWSGTGLEGFLRWESLFAPTAPF